MHQDDSSLKFLADYAKKYFRNDLDADLVVPIEDYPELAQKIMAELCVGKSKNHNMIRLAGFSGSGKTTQLLPTAECYAVKNNLQPVLVAARVFADYHPHKAEIISRYGEEDFRKLTDDFASLMMLIVMNMLTKMGFDIILDVSFVGSQLEAMLVKMINGEKYQALTLMVATSIKNARKQLEKRDWRHSEKTERELFRATSESLQFYAEACPEMRVIMWNAWEPEPVYDGPFKGAFLVWEKESAVDEVPAHDVDALLEAKKQYILQ